MDRERGDKWGVSGSCSEWEGKRKTEDAWVLQRATRVARDKAKERDGCVGRCTGHTCFLRTSIDVYCCSFSRHCCVRLLTRALTTDLLGIP